MTTPVTLSDEDRRTIVEALLLNLGGHIPKGERLRKHLKESEQCPRCKAINSALAALGEKPR